MKCVICARTPYTCHNNREVLKRAHLKHSFDIQGCNESRLKHTQSLSIFEVKVAEKKSFLLQSETALTARYPLNMNIINTEFLNLSDYVI